MAMDQDDVDLLIVMGSSLKVGPVNDIPDAIDESVPRILINREPLPHMPEFESELLGNCDEIVEYISSKLGYDIGVTKKEFVNSEWEKMCEMSAQKVADELKKKEAEKILKANPEPPEKKARIDCVPIEDDPNNLEQKDVPGQNENIIECNSDSDSEPETDQPVVEVKLGEYIAAPSGFQTLFHGCELPIRRLIEEANDSDSEELHDEDGQADLGSSAPSGVDEPGDGGEATNHESPEKKVLANELENSFGNPNGGSKSDGINPIDSASSGPTKTTPSSPSNKVQNEEKKENPSSLETDS